MLEKDLVEIGVVWLIKQGYSVGREVSVPSDDGVQRRIDVVAYDSKRRELIGIEFKIDDYKTCISQACNRLQCCDKVYMAFPTGMAKWLRRKWINHLKKLNIGLLCVYPRTEHIEVFFEPERSKILNKFKRMAILRRMNWLERLPVIYEDKIVVPVVHQVEETMNLDSVTKRMRDEIVEKPFGVAVYRNI